MTYYSPSDHFSASPLSDLVPITLKDMKKEGPYRGKCLILQNVVDPFQSVGITLIGEDIDGSVEKISLHHWIPQNQNFHAPISFQLE
jgi:hypothetical protein